jgi:hypothetical protein
MFVVRYELWCFLNATVYEDFFFILNEIDLFSMSGLDFENSPAS